MWKSSFSPQWVNVKIKFRLSGFLQTGSDRAHMQSVANIKQEYKIGYYSNGTVLPHTPR